jgi:hypothetical protein
LILLACTWPPCSAAIGNLGGYRTLGYTPCSEYAADYAASQTPTDLTAASSARFAAHTGFILGYLSAFNAWVVNDIVDITDNQPFAALFATVAEHCRSHPDDQLVQALEALVSKLWSNRDPQRVGKPPWPAGTRPAQ